MKTFKEITKTKFDEEKSKLPKKRPERTPAKFPPEYNWNADERKVHEIISSLDFNIVVNIWNQMVTKIVGSHCSGWDDWLDLYIYPITDINKWCDGDTPLEVLTNANKDFFAKDEYLYWQGKPKTFSRNHPYSSPISTYTIAEYILQHDDDLGLNIPEITKILNIWWI